MISKLSYTAGEYKCIVLERLEESNISTKSIGIPLSEGGKDCNINFTQKENRKSLKNINNNYSVYPEGDLTFVDIDDPEIAPDKILDNTTDTFSVESPHGEHRWVLCSDSIPNVKRDWGEIRTENQYVVGPGSYLTDCKHGCCSDSSPGVYELRNDTEIQRVTREELDEWIGGFETESEDNTTTTYREIEVPEYDSDIAQFAQKEFNKIKRESTSFFFDLHRRMEGGTGDLDDTLRTSGQIDRSKQDTLTVQHLYGFFKTTQGYSEERSVELAYNLYTHYCESYQYTKDGQRRKWITRGENYRERTVFWAIEQYDSDRYRKQLRKSTEGETARRQNLRKYGKPTYGLARFIVDLSVGEYDDYSSEEIQEYVLPQYNYSMGIGEIEVLVQLVNTHTTMSYDTPRMTESVGIGIEDRYLTKSDVSGICERVDGVYKGNKESSFDKALTHLQKNGEIKVAEIEKFERNVVYPGDYPDPHNANKIWHEGEVIKPTETIEVAPTMEV